MDSVGVERAGLQKDLDETNTEIRRAKEPLADESFVAKAKPALVEEQRTRLRQLEERRARLEENLKHLEETRPGGLPSTQAGTWSPLLLHQWAPTTADESADLPLTPTFVPGAARPPEHPSAREAASVRLSQEIAQIVLTGQRDKDAVRQLRDCMLHRAADDVSALRLLAAAFDGYGRSSHSPSRPGPESRSSAARRNRNRSKHRLRGHCLRCPRLRPFPTRATA